MLAFSLVFHCPGLVFQRFVGDVEELLRIKTKKFLGNFLEILRWLVMRLWESNFLLHVGWLERDSVCGSCDKPLKKWDFSRRPRCPRAATRVSYPGASLPTFTKARLWPPPPLSQKGDLYRKFKVGKAKQKELLLQKGRLSPSCSHTSELSKSICPPSLEREPCSWLWNLRKLAQRPLQLSLPTFRVSNFNRQCFQKQLSV